MKTLLRTTALGLLAGAAFAANPDYADDVRGLARERDDKGLHKSTRNTRFWPT
jgi:hypothetical protein